MNKPDRNNTLFSHLVGNYCVTIEIPPYLTPWDVDDVIYKSLRKMCKSDATYLIDFSSVKNVYSATAKLILRLYDRANRLNASIQIINACEPVQNALKSLKLNERIPMMDAIKII